MSKNTSSLLVRIPFPDTHCSGTMTESISSAGKVSCGHIQYGKERGTGCVVYRLCPETSQPRWNLPPITMSTVWIVGLGGLLMLCFGMLIGSTWTVQILNRQFRRLAIERRELNATRLALQDTTLRCRRCGNLIANGDRNLTS
jgi:hypothetical protein